MVRQWFSLSAALALAVLIVATDSSQARQRRLGRRFRGDSDGYVFNGRFRGYSNGYAAMEPQTGSRRADYYSPDTPGAAMQPSPVLVELRVPANAEILFDGTKTVQKGTLRRYISPPIEPGRHYAYVVKAMWMEDGREKTETRTLTVHAGERRTADLTKPAPEPLTKPSPVKDTEKE